MAYMLQIEEEDCIIPDRLNTIKVGETSQLNFLELKKDSRKQI